MTESKKKKPKPNGTEARPMVFFKNYDYVDNDPNGPGEGIYSGDMDKYKSVSDFRKKNKKRRMKLRRALFLYELSKVADKKEKDKNNLSDPTENTITPIPYPPAEVSAVGMFDGIYPQTEKQDEPYSNLYYGILDGQHADDKEPNDDKKNKKA